MRDSQFSHYLAHFSYTFCLFYFCVCLIWLFVGFVLFICLFFGGGVFEKGLHYVARLMLKSGFFLKCGDYRHIPPHLSHFLIL